MARSRRSIKKATRVLRARSTSRARRARLVEPSAPPGGPVVVSRPERTMRGIPAAVRVNIARKGVSDLPRMRMAWTIGYIYVGDGTNGAANEVLFLTSDSAHVGDYHYTNDVAVVVPILGSDTVLGKNYVSDISKHYSRKVIHRMWFHANALVPSTSSAMLAAIGFVRGPGSVASTYFAPYATAAATGNPLDYVTSMSGSDVVTSFEHKTWDITRFIAGGSGQLQNEFNISTQNQQATVVVDGSFIGAQIAGGAEGVVPACFAVAGNNTVASLQGVKLFELVVEQEVSLLDYVGGSVARYPLV